MRKGILTIGLIGSILVAVASLVFAGLMAAIIFFGAVSSADTLVAMPNNLLYASIVLAFGIVAPALAALAAYQAARSLSGRPGRTFGLASWGWFLLALIVVLAAGQALLMAQMRPPVALLHVVAAILGALLMLAIPLGAARRHGWSIGRGPGIGSLAWGALGGVGLAIVLEIGLLLVVLIGAVLVLNATNPGWLEQLQSGFQGFQGAPGDIPLHALSPILSNPLVLLGAIVVMAVLVPLIEEVAKSLAAPLVLAVRGALTRTDAFLLGAAAGAGFALIEGITNGATALAEPSSWWLAMAARGGVASIHVLASALAGLAWHSAIVERRWGRGLSYFAAAVALHGAWNGGTVVVAWLGLQVGDPVLAAGLGNARLLAGSLATLVVVSGLGAVFLGSLVLLAWLPARLARVEEETRRREGMGH